MASGKVAAEEKKKTEKGTSGGGGNRGKAADACPDARAHVIAAQKDSQKNGFLPVDDLGMSGIHAVAAIFFRCMQTL